MELAGQRASKATAYSRDGCGAEESPKSGSRSSGSGESSLFAISPSVAAIAQACRSSRGRRLSSVSRSLSFGPEAALFAGQKLQIKVEVVVRMKECRRCDCCWPRRRCRRRCLGQRRCRRAISPFLSRRTASAAAAALCCHVSVSLFFATCACVCVRSACLNLAFF